MPVENFRQDSFLLNEDEAIRNMLKGLTVSDRDNPSRPVGVYFGMPDPEIRAKAYPFIVVDMLGVREDTERVMNAFIEITDPPKDLNVPPGMVAKTLYPTPVKVTYQITSMARHPRHDRSILAQMAYGRLHPRFAQITVGTDAGMIFRLEVRGMEKRDMIVDNRRLFRNIWTVDVCSEFYYWPIEFYDTAKKVLVGVEVGVPDTYPAVYLATY